MESQNENLSEQLNSLVEYNYAETPVLAGISRMREVVALKPVCENMGISWSWQFEQIKNDSNLSQLFGKLKVISKDGKEREMICLPLNAFQNWLWEIKPTDKMNLHLWEEYKKGLVLHLSQMLKVSMDEVIRLRHIEKKYGEAHFIMAVYFKNENDGKDHYSKGKVLFKENKKLRDEIMDIFKDNPNQLALDI